MSDSRLNWSRTLPLFWQSKLLFLGIPAAFILLAIVAVYSVPPEYEAVAILSPATGVWQGALLPGAGEVVSRLTRASMMEGLPLYSAQAQKAEAIGILRSDVLAEELISQQHLSTVINRAAWGGVPGNSPNGTKGTKSAVLRAVSYFSKQIRTVKLDSQTGLVALRIRWNDPVVAATWADQLVALANAYCRARALTEARRDISFLKLRLSHTSDLRQQNVIAELIRSELDTEMVASGSGEYAFRTIDPPAIQQEPVFPRPLDVIAFGASAGTIVSLWLLLIRFRRATTPRRAPAERNGTKSPAHLDPKLLGIASIAGGILLTLYPPDAYSALIDEPDLMFLNWRLLAFLALCLGGFLFGSRFAAETGRELRPLVSWSQAEAKRRQRLAVWLALIGSLTGVVVAGIFVKDARGYLSAISEGGAQAIRAAALASLLNTGFAATNVLPLGFPLLLWAAGNMGNEKSKSSLGARGVIYTCLVVYALCCVVTLSRSLLMPYILAVLIVLSGTLWSPGGLRPKKLVLSLLAMLAAVSGLFLIIAYFRSGAENSPLMMLAGYIPASYNRLAAVLSGQLTSSAYGVPYFSFRFLWYPPLLHRVVSLPHIGHEFGWSIPSESFTSWFSEFEQVASADMNPMFIWPTAFGYTFYDFAWWSPVYFIVVGFLARVLWRHFVARTTYGLILYPYVAASILLWSTDNFLALPGLWVLVGVAIALRPLDGPRALIARKQYAIESG